MLSDVAVRQAKAKDKDYKLSDSEGLYLFVTKAGHRSWRLKYRFAGKERRLILGSYPEVSLKDAREKKLDAGSCTRRHHQSCFPLGTHVFAFCIAATASFWLNQ